MYLKRLVVSGVQVIDKDATDPVVIEGDESPLVLREANSHDQLLTSLESNVCKTFAMPLFAEIVSIHRVGNWRDQLKMKISDVDQED